MSKVHTDFAVTTNYLILIATFLCIMDLFTFSNGSNQYSSNGIDSWNSTTDFVPIQNQSYGTLKLKTGFRMTFDILFHDKTDSTNWENIFRIGHAGHSSTDYNCAKNDRFPALWINAESDSFVFDVSDKTNCFRQYANFIISPHTFYHITIQYNSSWLTISINNNTITNEARSDLTETHKLGTDIYIYISTVTSIPANVTLSNIRIITYDDNTINASTTHPLSSISPTHTPSQSPTYAPTIYPTTTATLSPTMSRSPTKKPTTFLPSIFTTPPDTLFAASTTETALDAFTTETEQPLQVTTTQKTALYSLRSTDYDAYNTAIDEGRQDKALSFEVIFYILTGCAMGGILFCVFACCCFGCILNKKIKRLADDECHIGHMHANGASADKLAGDKVRLSTMSGDSDDSGDSADSGSAAVVQEEDMESINIINGEDIQSPTTSPSQCISNRFSSSPSQTCHITHSHNHTKTCTATLTNSNQTVVELAKNRYRQRTEFTEQIPSMDSRHNSDQTENELQHKISINRNNESIELSASDIECGTEPTHVSHLQLTAFNTQQTAQTQTQTLTEEDIEMDDIDDVDENTQLQTNESSPSILSPLMAESVHGHNHSHAHGHFFARKLKKAASNPSHYSLYVHKHSSGSPNMHKLQLQRPPMPNHRKLSLGKQYQIHIDHANVNVNDDIITNRNGNGELIVYDHGNEQNQIHHHSLGNIEMEKSRNHKCISYGDEEIEEEELKQDDADINIHKERSIPSFKSMKSPNSNTNNNTPVSVTAKAFLQLPINGESIRSNVSNQSNSSSSSSASNNSNSSGSSSSSSASNNSNSYAYSTSVVSSNSNSMSSSASSSNSNSSHSNSESTSSATVSTYTAATSLSSTRYKSTPNTTITTGYKSTPHTITMGYTPDTRTRYKSTPNTVTSGYKSTNTMINVNTPEIHNDDEDEDEDEESRSNMTESSCYYSNAQHSEF